MLRFSSPYFLFLLIIPAGLIIYQGRKKLTPALRMALTGTGLDLPEPLMVKISRMLPYLKIIALVLMILAMAGPQKGVKDIRIVTEGINIVLAVDVSESMAALDFKVDNKSVNRLEAVKGVVLDFISGRTGDRIGLVVFGSAAYTQTPLTRDYEAINHSLDNLKIGSAGKQTAVGDALGISLKRIKDVESKSNVIILLTDGRSNTGEIHPEAAAELVTKAGVKVYTIGVGGRGRAPFIVDGPFGGKRIIHRRVDIDEDTLKKIAAKTGGLYFRAEDSEGLKKIYDTINEMEKNKVEVLSFAEYNNLYPYFLLPAFLLLIVWVLLINTRFLKAP